MKNPLNPLVVILSVLMCLVVNARELGSVKIESEIADSLGVKANKFEVTLQANEVMIVRCQVKTHIDDKAELTEYETQDAFVGSSEGDQKVKFVITSIELATIHPSLFGKVTLRAGSSGSGFNGLDKDAILSSYSTGPDGISYEFRNFKTGLLALSAKWTAYVEKYETIVKDWADLPRPMSGYSGSRRLLMKDADGKMKELGK